MDPALAELDFTGGFTEAEQANLALLDSWDRHEAEATRVLSETVSGFPDGTSILSKAVQIASDIPAGRNVIATVFCTAPTGDVDLLEAGIRLSSRDLPQEPPVYVTLCTVQNEAYIPADDRITEENAVTIGNLVIGKIRWAKLRGVRLSDDCAEIVLPTPALPATTEL